MVMCDDYQQARVRAIAGDVFVAVSDDNEVNTNGNNSFIRHDK